MSGLMQSSPAVATIPSLPYRRSVSCPPLISFWHSHEALRQLQCSGIPGTTIGIQAEGISLEVAPRHRDNARSDRMIQEDFQLRALDSPALHQLLIAKANCSPPASSGARSCSEIVHSHAGIEVCEEDFKNFKELVGASSHSAGHIEETMQIESTSAGIIQMSKTSPRSDDSGGEDGVHTRSTKQLNCRRRLIRKGSGIKQKAWRNKERLSVSSRSSGYLERGCTQAEAVFCDGLFADTPRLEIPEAMYD
jgi:hypothetical protein